MIEKTKQGNKYDDCEENTWHWQKATLCFKR